jgi:hypothetical protein
MTSAKEGAHGLLGLSTLSSKQLLSVQASHLNQILCSVYNSGGSLTLKRLRF